MKTPLCSDPGTRWEYGTNIDFVGKAVEAVSGKRLDAYLRDHLLALQEIQDALAAGAFDRAADVAEQRLGMSSLIAHGAHEVAKYMPKGMQDAGTAMHRSASRFSVAALDAAVTDDVKPALGALAEVTANCVACHAAYRLQ